VNYTLTSVATGKVVHAGQVATEVFYDSVDEPYAGIAARQNTQERVASDAARRIQIELAAWMARSGRPGGG
jgi:LPS-assembly lipoprotein